IEDTQGAIARLDAEAGELHHAQAGQSEAQSAAEARVTETRTGLEARERELDQLNQEVARLTAERQRLEKAIENGRSRVERLQRQLDDIAHEQASLSDAAEKQAAIDLHSAELEAAASRMAEAERAALDAEEARRMAQEAEKAAREPMSQAERRAGDLAAEAKTLADLLATDESDLWPPMIDRKSTRL